MVADSGLEPERLTAPHFEGGVSSNSTNQPWCGIGYSKPYALRHPSLNQMCLPVPPIPHMKKPPEIPEAVNLCEYCKPETMSFPAGIAAPDREACGG